MQHRTDIQEQARPNARKQRSGGLVSSGFIGNRVNPVLTEDIYLEPTRTNGVIKLAGDFVRFFDESDSMLHTISAVFNTSPTTRSIIRQKTTLVIGDGLMLMKGQPNTLFPALAKGAMPVSDPGVIEALDERLMSVNSDGETIIEVAEKVVQEFLTYGNGYVVLSRPETGGELYCHHIPFVKGRISERRKDDDAPQVIGLNDEWKERVWTDSNVVRVPLYPVWSESDENGVQRTIIHLKDFAPGFEYYGLPEWVAALMYAEIEYRIAKFNSSKFDNSFVPSGILQFFGATSEAEAQAIIRSIKSKYIGTGKNGGLFIQVLRDKSLEANYTKIEDELEGSFLDLARVSAQAIVSAHRWTMSLAGFATKGQLGSNEQIRREFEIAQNTVIRPLQNMLCRRFLNVYLSELAKIDSRLGGLYLDIQNAMPVSFIGDININDVLTADERREIAGYPPAPKEEKQQQQPEPQPDNGSNNDTDTDTAG